MSSSLHKVCFERPLCDVRASAGGESLVSRNALEAELNDRYQSGFEAGQRALAEELVNQRAHLLRIKNEVLRSIQQTLPDLSNRWEQSLIALALTAARRLVHGLPIDATLVEGAVRAALAELQNTAEYSVRLHPEDHKLLHEIQSPLLPSFGQEKIRFIADAQIPRGDCRIETDHGAVVINRERSWNRIEEAALC